MKTPYLDLSIGAPARLAILRRDFTQWFIRNPHAPRERVTSWRNVRFGNLREHSELGQGSNGEGRACVPVWYTQSGPQFRGEQFADKVIHMDHTGWFTNDEAETSKDGSGLARGIVARLPHGKIIAGYWWGDNDERVYFADIYDDLEDAARMADEHARVFAESARQDDAKFNEAQALQDANERATQRLREVLALRNNKRFPDMRGRARLLIAAIRKREQRLSTEFAGMI